MNKYKRANALIHSFLLGQGIALLLWSALSCMVLYDRPILLAYSVVALIGSLWFCRRMAEHWRNYS